MKDYDFVASSDTVIVLETWWRTCIDLKKQSKTQDEQKDKCLKVYQLLVTKFKEKWRQQSCASTPHWITAYSIQTCIYLSNLLIIFLN